MRIGLVDVNTDRGILLVISWRSSTELLLFLYSPMEYDQPCGDQSRGITSDYD